jgi:uncharacterized protein YdhG (YjbR/CyaY superfamily)
MTSRPASVSQYIATFPRGSQRALTRVRGAIKSALPEAEEVISYGIPAYKLHGRIVIYFAGWHEHYSIYPLTATLEAAFEKPLERYEKSGRGTLRFPLGEAVPVKLIGDLARFRAKETAERTAKAAVTRVVKKTVKKTVKKAKSAKKAASRSATPRAERSPRRFRAD